MDTKWLHIEDFSHVIDVHDKFRDSGKFEEWRTTFSTHSSGLADHFLKSFSSIKGTMPSKEELVSAFNAVSKDDFKSDYSSIGSRVFDPWMNWFHGYWDNGTSRTANYHIWDFTVPLAGRYVQPVTQSVTAFAYSKDESGNRVNVLEKMVKSKKTDIAVDFFSPDDGITGWVTKLQANEEMPHVGYLIGDKILIWIAQYVGKTENEWYMFFERGNQTKRASIYEVDGIKFKVDSSTGVGPSSDKWGSGKVRYYCQKPYTMQPACYVSCD